MSDYGTEEVSTLSFIFGRHADSEEVKGFLEPLSQFLTEKMCLEGEKIEAYIGDDPDIIEVNFFALARPISSSSVFQCLSEMSRDVVGFNDPQVKIWARTHVQRLWHITHN